MRVHELPSRNLACHGRRYNPRARSHLAQARALIELRKPLAAISYLNTQIDLTPFCLNPEKYPYPSS